MIVHGRVTVRAIAAASFRGRVAVAVFVEVFHGDGTSNSSSWFISSRNSNTRRASASSIRERAKPTWTSTYSSTCDLGDVLQADALGDAAELDLAHQHVVLAVGLDHLAGDSEAHRQSPPSSRTDPAVGRRRDRQLAQAQAAVVGRHQAMPVDPEAVAAPAARPPRPSAGRSGTRRRSGPRASSPVRPAAGADRGDRSRPASNGTAGR